MCKIFEKIIRDNIVQDLESNNLIAKNQHAFRKGKSCLSNLLEFFEEVIDYVDKGIPVDVIYLDFQKAFDKVPHKRLMEKVQALGITGRIADWLVEWLSNRQQ